MQMAIVDLPSMIAEDTRKRSSNAATPYQQDPCSFRAALHPRRDSKYFQSTHVIDRGYRLTITAQKSTLFSPCKVTRSSSLGSAGLPTALA